MAGTDAVNHPAHYGGADNPYEAIKVIEAWDLGFCLGNAVKYIARAPHKGNFAEDLKKARWYLDRAIAADNGGLADDVVDLVLAAREVAFVSKDRASVIALDKASEAFSSRVPWPDDPNNEPQD